MSVITSGVSEGTRNMRHVPGRRDRIETRTSGRKWLFQCAALWNGSESSSVSRWLATSYVNQWSVTCSLATRNANKMLIIHASLSNKRCPKAGSQCCQIFYSVWIQYNFILVHTQRVSHGNNNALRTVKIRTSLTILRII
jgi:hypothetical protein